jgi:4-hydroxy-tetrahydrodipicolinate synthase
MFRGSCVALVTPFKNGEVDYDKLKELVNWHVDVGTDCIVPCGCTGEAATLNHSEHKKVIKTIIKEAAGRVNVMPGTGSNSTWETLELTEYAKKSGADAALIITPYYNKPTQEGLYRHYKNIAEEVDIPVCLYNVPSRTGINLEAHTVKRLSEIDNIQAVKEASGDISQCAKIINLCGDDITLLSGDDSMTYAIMALGGKGVVSVLANIVPEAVHSLTDSFLKGDTAEALKIHNKWFPLMEALFVETNPAPVKEALGMTGKIIPELRMPLVNLKNESRQFLKKALNDAGIETV